MARRAGINTAEWHLQRFFLLADSPSEKRKYLYLLGTDYPLKFFKSGRALNSVLSKDNKIRELFYLRHGQRFAKVRDYYRQYGDTVIIKDMTSWLPELAEVISESNTIPEPSESAP